MSEEEMREMGVELAKTVASKERNNRARRMDLDAIKVYAESELIRLEDKR